MKKIITILFLFIFCYSFGQQAKKIRYFVGYGMYDGVNIGTEYYLKDSTKILTASIGYERLFTKKQQTYALSFSYKNAIFVGSKNIINQYKWHINSTITIWQLEDDFYLWRFVSFTPSISRTFIAFKKHNFLFEFGPIFNLVVHSKRKTFDEIGWPYKVMPNFRIIFIL